MNNSNESDILQNAINEAKKHKVTDKDIREHFKDAAHENDEVEVLYDDKKKKNSYGSRHHNVSYSPARFDPFAADATPTHQTTKRTYANIVQEDKLNKEVSHLESLIEQQQKQKVSAELANKYISLSSDVDHQDKTPSNLVKVISEVKSKSKYDASNTPSRGMWAETPIMRDQDYSAHGSTVNRSQWDSTPAIPSNQTVATPGTANKRSSRWDVTPVGQSNEFGKTTGDWTVTPKNLDINDQEAAMLAKASLTGSATRRKSRWDETPSQTPGSSLMPGSIAGSSQLGTPITPSINASGQNLATPMTGSISFSPSMTMTPSGPKAMAMMTPSMTNYYSTTPGASMTPVDTKYKIMSDQEIDEILPKTGFKIHRRPANYIPIKHNMPMASNMSGTPTPLAGPGGFFIPQSPAGSSSSSAMVNMQPSGDLPQLKESDLEYFDKLLKNTDAAKLTGEQIKEREIMALLLKVKNGTPQMRKSALREITRRAQEFGPGPLLNQILPLLMSPSLEDQERHLMVKVIDRLLYKLDDAVRPYVHKILVVIEPMLIDEDYFARVEGREIISNLAKAAGLATMIATMRPDIDHTDEYVRNTTARAFAVVASSLGVGQILPFLKAVCRSTKSWHARHTGIKIVQQIAILMGCSILPYLKGLVETIEQGLSDDELKVRVIAALAISALAEASTPYGIESFDSVLKPLWTGIRTHRGKSLAALLKAIGYLIPLMDSEYAFRYTCEVMAILVREFNSPDEEMKKIVLKVVKQCCSTDGVEADYIRSEILPPFFRSFWTQRMALDRRNYQQLVDTTVEIASKVGSIDILSKIVDDLKDESEGFRKMVMETIERIVVELGIDSISTRMEEQLIDGCLYAYQEQISEDVTMLNGFGAVINALGSKARAYLPQISATVLWRLNNKNHRVRQQAADLIAKIAPIIKLGQEEKLLSHISLVLFEYLGEEYPEVLGSIIGALKSIVSVVGMTKMNPPIKDLLPRLTPILKNRHEKVQENCVELVGRIADRGAEFVSAREWMRICFELLESLKAHKKSIRRAAVNTFGYIAKAIGPHDVLTALLNNLKVQERQLRVCTTVAIAIVAETCSPFTVLPSLMNEYRVPDLNVQHGVLKTLSFMFEYIGEMAKDYIYAVIPIFEDALMERDIIHRQTAMFAIGHLSVGVAGFGNGDSLTHLLNLLWPNIFETSPHVVQAFMNCIDGMRLSIGAGKILLYVIQGLFHPARRVREAYWRVYNAIYIGAEDSLTPYYPRVFNTENNHYVRYELDYVL